MRLWNAHPNKQAVNIYQEIRSNIQGLDRELQRSFIKLN